MFDESVAFTEGRARGRSGPAAARLRAGAWQARRACQAGLSLVGMIFIGIIVVFLLAIGAKAVPALSEYFAIDRAVQKVANEGSTVRDIRAAFDRYATVDDIKSIYGKDLDITKDGERIIVSYSYTYSIPISDNVRIVIDFAGSNRDHPGRGTLQP
jgi:Domain of unknown function (DUF4845)